MATKETVSSPAMLARRSSQWVNDARTASARVEYTIFAPKISSECSETPDARFAEPTGTENISWEKERSPHQKATRPENEEAEHTTSPDQSPVTMKRTMIDDYRLLKSDPSRTGTNPMIRSGLLGQLQDFGSRFRSKQDDEHQILTVEAGPSSGSTDDTPICRKFARFALSRPELATRIRVPSMKLGNVLASKTMDDSGGAPQAAA